MACGPTGESDLVWFVFLTSDFLLRCSWSTLSFITYNQEKGLSQPINTRYLHNLIICISYHLSVRIEGNVSLRMNLLSIEESFLTQWFFIIFILLFTHVNSHNLADKAIKRYKTKFPSFYCCSQDLCFMCIFNTVRVSKTKYKYLEIFFHSNISLSQYFPRFTFVWIFIRY